MLAKDANEAAGLDGAKSSMSSMPALNDTLSFDFETAERRRAMAEPANPTGPPDEPPEAPPSVSSPSPPLRALAPRRQRRTGAGGRSCGRSTPELPRARTRAAAIRRG